MHLRRIRVHGSVDGGKHYGGAEKFYQEVVLTDTRGHDDECLIWPFGRGSRHGYATMRNPSGSELVHRRLCEEVHGEPPTPDHEAAHSCNRGKFGCVTQGHLRWATHKENMDDKLIHGTHNRGARNWRAKLTEADIPMVRSLLGTDTYAAIGEKFGVSASTIWQIDKGNSWAWLQ